MSDYTVSIVEAESNTISVEEEASANVTIQDILNSVTVSETDGNSVTVVASTFINSAGSSSNLYYSTGNPSDSLGSEGDFYIDTSIGKLWGPKNELTWASEPLPLIPKRHTHTQSSASSSWTITHSLDGFPSVTVVDSAGTVVVGEVSYNSTSSLTVAFQSAFAGKAYLT
jgi:hypothetical protein